MERAFFRHADEIVMLTERIKGELLKTEPALANRADDITVIPCCVDTARFNISDEQRNSYRAERGWHDKRVITYAGKIGMWYLHDEMARFFSHAWRYDPHFFFQVLTQSDPAPLEQALNKYGIPANAYDIRFVPPEQLPLVLTASDAGISFIRGCYSKLASSPTKNGEYLAAGLPIIINAGIGDSDQQTKTHRLGVVLQKLSDTEFERGIIELEQLLTERAAKAHCQEFAANELSLATVGRARYTAIYEQLLIRATSQITNDLSDVSLEAE
jgi:glycosyltransferase involved in cell wall biosynthesis